MEIGLIHLRYDCGNNFDLTNGNTNPVTVAFEVEGTRETGELTLAAAVTPGRPSQTQLSTTQRGSVVIAYQRQRFAQQANLGVVCSPPAQSDPRAIMGEWSAPFPWPIVAVHLQLLPSGRVLSWGREGGPQLWNVAELWDPDTEQWTTWGGNSVIRVHHSTTLLLPDGRVLHTGSGAGHDLPRELNAELFSPPYLLHGARPEIASAPQTVDYGANFFVATPDAGTVTRSTWVRLSPVTHAFDQDQRFSELNLRRSAGGVTLTAPDGENVALPGDYMLFLLTGDGVRSLASIVRLN